MNAQSVTDNLSSITLDLMSAMHIDSVKVGGTLVSFAQNSSNFELELKPPVQFRRNDDRGSVLPGLAGQQRIREF